MGRGPAVLLLVTGGPELERHAAREVARAYSPSVVTVLAADAGPASDDIRCRILAECLNGMSFAAVIGEPWTEGAVAHLAMTRQGDALALRVEHVAAADGTFLLESTRDRGKVRVRQTVIGHRGRGWWFTLAEDAEVQPVASPTPSGETRIERWAPRLERLYGRGDLQQLLQEIKQEAGVVRLADAEFIIDVGFGVANRDGYEAVIEPLERVLRDLGVRGLMIGGSRKVTEELHLLPVDRQIGQSGVSVNPRVLLAIGVSGAPQHLNYIGPRATIVAFNRDPEAPLITLNQRQAQPRVFPVVGDLFETVPALTAALREEQPAPAATAAREGKETFGHPQGAPAGTGVE
jgi:electron transfer flavoprotein alpha subunit